jgi:NADPH-dependent ferric siderophore reductase
MAEVGGVADIPRSVDVARRVRIWCGERKKVSDQVPESFGVTARHGHLGPPYTESGRTEVSEVSGPDELVTRLQGVGRWTLEVVESRLITPRMRRIKLRSDEFRGFEYLAGQDVMLWVPADAGRMLYRRYTIRHLDPEAGSLDLDVFDHGMGGPGEHWAKTVRPGESVEVVGPRGKISPVVAPWHLFAGDETYLPATFAMVATLPEGTPAWVYLEVEGAQEEQPLAVSADLHLTWIHRGAAAPGDPAGLAAALESARLPLSPGHAYVGAELQVAKALRRTLEARGFDAAHISSKAYWGRGRANAGIGEPKEAEASQ